MSVMINDTDLAAIWQEIVVELMRAERLHPVYPADHLRRTAIMVEEAGEALRAALDATRDAPGYPPTHQLKVELVQTAAMCIKQLRAMREEEP
jgi:hypothetical protein